MIKFTSKKLKETIKNGKEKLLEKVDKIYNKRIAIVGQPNYYFQNMIEWNKFDQLNIPIAYQSLSINKSFRLNPALTIDDIEESFFTKSEEILQLREDLIPLFSVEDEYHDKREIEFTYQWAKNLYVIGLPPDDHTGNFDKLSTMKPTKQLMNKSKLVKDVWHYTKMNSTYFAIIAEFETLSALDGIEIYENHNSGAIVSIEADVSSDGSHDWQFCWKSVMSLGGSRQSAILMPFIDKNLGIKTKTIKINVDTSKIRPRHNYQIAGVCMATRNQAHPIVPLMEVNAFFFDIKVKVIDDGKSTVFKSHKIVLSKSERFAAALLENPKIEEITIYCSLDIFKKFFFWMYSGKMVCDKSQQFDILAFATEYGFRDVKFVAVTGFTVAEPTLKW